MNYDRCFEKGISQPCIGRGRGALHKAILLSIVSERITFRYKKPLPIGLYEIITFVFKQLN